MGGVDVGGSVTENPASEALDRREAELVARERQVQWAIDEIRAVLAGTVATLIDRESNEGDASVQLGHSGTAVTRRHYIEKAIEAPDLTEVLDQLGG